ncbi:MAG: U32 family peptidase [Clostridia bacterium]|nr:U32 family peptidase [Clostridia bacterium]
MKPELLAPAGTYEKMVTAFRFGADAVYFAGKKFGLRAFAGNFDDKEIETAVEYAHARGKKVYITINILAHENDFEGLAEYVQYLEKVGVDAVIVADLGIISLVRDVCPNLEVHVSTQANVLNSFAINFLAKMGIKRIILAREVGIEEIKAIRKKIPADIELECFVHGAMCISYSGRCLLSNYLSGRDSNRGACVQACRWQYMITEITRHEGNKYEIQEDERGTYILNSKDLCMIQYLKALRDAGVNSFKIEGRMKSEYYVATVVNAYRKALDGWENLDELKQELEKASHRTYTTGFYLPNEQKENLASSMPVQSHEFVAVVEEDANGKVAKIQQRNRFAQGDELEVLSPNANTFNKTIVVESLTNLAGEEVIDAKQVQQILFLKTSLPLQKGDILRKKI